MNDNSQLTPYLRLQLQRLGKFLCHRPMGFLAAGAFLYLSYAFLKHNPEKTLVLTEQDIAFLLRMSQDEPSEPPLTPQALRLLAIERLRHLALVNAARRAGLDQGDLIIERRLAQKMMFLLTPPGEPSEPQEKELAAFLHEHASRYRIEGTVSFTHLFFPGATPLACQNAVLAMKKVKQGLPVDSKPFFLGNTVNHYTLDEIKSRFDARFADALKDLPLGQWAGPISSRFGCHAVKVTERTPGFLPSVHDIKPRLLADWQRSSQARAQQLALCQLFLQYRVKAPKNLDISSNDLCPPLD